MNIVTDVVMLAVKVGAVLAVSLVSVAAGLCGVGSGLRWRRRRRGRRRVDARHAHPSNRGGAG